MLSLNPVAGVDVDQMKKIWAITSQYDYKFVRLGLVSFLAHFEQTMENLQVAKNWQSRLLPTIGVGGRYYQSAETSVSNLLLRYWKSALQPRSSIIIDRVQFCRRHGVLCDNIRPG